MGDIFTQICDTLNPEIEKLQKENNKLREWKTEFNECGYFKDYESSIMRLKKENLKLKEAMKAELKRRGGTVPILSECLEEME